MAAYLGMWVKDGINRRSGRLIALAVAKPALSELQGSRLHRPLLIMISTESRGRAQVTNNEKFWGWDENGGAVTKSIMSPGSKLKKSSKANAPNLAPFRLQQINNLPLPPVPLFPRDLSAHKLKVVTPQVSPLSFQKTACSLARSN